MRYTFQVDYQTVSNRLPHQQANDQSGLPIEDLLRTGTVTTVTQRKLNPRTCQTIAIRNMSCVPRPQHTTRPAFSYGPNHSHGHYPHPPASAPPPPYLGYQTLVVLDGTALQLQAAALLIQGLLRRQVWIRSGAVHCPAVPGSSPPPLVAGAGTTPQLGLWGQGRSGQVRAGQVRLGQDRSWQGRAGQVKSNQVREGKGRAGQYRTGQDRTGQGRAGQGRAGQGGVGQVGVRQDRKGQGSAGQVKSGQSRAGGQY